MAKNPTAKRELILVAATDVFSRKGFLNATISEIAREAGVGDATIYGFFQNKEDLLFAIPENALVSFLESIRSHLQGLKNPEEKIRKYIWHQLDFYQKNRNYTGILILELSKNLGFYRTKAHELLRQYAKILLEIISQGQAEGLFRPELNPYIIRSTIFGTLENLALNWLVFGKPKDLLEGLEDLFGVILDGIRVLPVH